MKLQPATVFWVGIVMAVFFGLGVFSMAEGRHALGAFFLGGWWLWSLAFAWRLVCHHAAVSQGDTDG